MTVIDAIIYKSNMGHTKKYAEMLSEILNIPAVTTRYAFTKLPKGSKVIFMGWIRGVDYMGYNAFIKKHIIRAACVIGAAETGTDLLEYVRKKNKISNDIPVFYLRGGYNKEGVKGADRQMAEVIIEKLAKKRKKLDNCGENLSEYETELLETLIYGGDFVEAKRLCEIVSWYKNNIT